TTHHGTTNKSRALQKYLSIPTLQMSMCSEHRRYATIKITAKGDFLTRGLAVSINDDAWRFTAHLRYRCIEERKRILEDRMHEGARLHVDHAHFSFGCLQNDCARAWRSGRIIQRAQKSRLRLEEGLNLFAIPNVIAGGN